MRKTYTLLVFTLLMNSFFISSAQVQFQKLYHLNPINGNNIIQNSDSSYVLASEVNLALKSGAKVSKLDKNGNYLWQHFYKRDDYQTNKVNTLLKTFDGGYLVGGHYSITGSNNGFLNKVDSSGNLQWSKSYQMPGSNANILTSIIQTNDSGYIITGYGYINSTTYDDMFIAKVNSNGSIVWSKKISGPGYDWSYGIVQANDGGYVLTGVSGNPGVCGIDLIKLGSTGNILWANHYGGCGDMAYGLDKTADGGFIITGEVFSTNVCFILKTDSIGNLDWCKTFGEISPSRWSGKSVHQTMDGGYILSGSRRSTGSIYPQDEFIIKTDLHGDILWTKNLGSTRDVNACIIQTSDFGYMVAGTICCGVFGTGGESDGYLIKTDSLGNSGCNDLSASIVLDSLSYLPSPINFTISSGVTSSTLITPDTIDNETIITLCANVGINEKENLKFLSVAPNPTLGNFHLSFDSIIKNAEIIIYNSIGQVVYYETTTNVTSKDIDLINTSPGIYFIKVFNEQESFIEKLIIE